MPRAHHVLAAALLLAVSLAGPAAAAREVPLQTYEARLDATPRAHVPGWGHSELIRDSDFRDLRQGYHPATYQTWLQRLQAVRLGMTAEEVQATLQPRRTDPATRVKSRTITTYILDPAYFLWAIYSPTGKLRAISRHPLAITYDVIPDHDVPKR